MKDTALFIGGSITLGLGLEIELRPKYNNHEWLVENGLMLPLVREKEDQHYWKTYRYSKLVSDKLGLIEYNVHDYHDTQIGGDSINTIWLLRKYIDTFSDLLNRVKYIFFDIGFIRWYDENLHGLTNTNKLPNTINEVIEYIKNPNNDRILTEKALNWLLNLDIDSYWDESIKKYLELKELYPDIKFFILPWSYNDGDVLMTKRIDDMLINDMIFFGEDKTMYNFLTKNKLMVGDVAKGFNGNYRYNIKDLHPCVEGHKQIADIILKRIESENK